MMMVKTNHDRHTINQAELLVESLCDILEEYDYVDIHHAAKEAMIQIIMDKLYFCKLAALADRSLRNTDEDAWHWNFLVKFATAITIVSMLLASYYYWRS